jgi:hypothetical protein
MTADRGAPGPRASAGDRRAFGDPVADRVGVDDVFAVGGRRIRAVDTVVRGEGVRGRVERVGVSGRQAAVIPRSPKKSWRVSESTLYGNTGTIGASLPPTWSQL